MPRLVEDLLAGEVHVWLADPNWLSSPAVERWCLARLDEAERQREVRLIAKSARLEFLIGRGLVRGVLSKYCAVGPAELGFDENAHGRPSLRDLPPGLDLRFNLSHTRGLAALAVAVSREVGVDVEAADRDLDFLPIARRKFAPGEAASVLAASGDERRELFYRYWTLKEAFIKAKGIGLSLPLDKFEFRFSGARVEVSFAPPLDDRPEEWRFALYRASAAHRLAVAVDSSSPATPAHGRVGRGRRLVFRRFHPLEGVGAERSMERIASSTEWPN